MGRVIKNHVKCITINVDASYSSQYKVAGYAFWIVCDKFVIKKSGMMKVSPKGSEDAELMGIANAVYTLLKTPELPCCKLVVINNDCLGAQRKIGHKSQNPIARKIAGINKQLRSALYSTGTHPVIEFRHVKAHSGAKDKRSYVNEWCDAEAKKWMREAIKISTNG